MTRPYGHRLVVQAVPWSVSSPGLVKADATSVVATDESALAQYQGKLHGRVVFFGDPPRLNAPLKPLPHRFSDDELRSGSALDGLRYCYQIRDQRLGSIAARKQFSRRLALFFAHEGVAAVVLSSSAREAGSGTGLLDADDSGVPGGRAWRADERATFPVLRTTVEDFERISRLLAKGHKIQVELEVHTASTDSHEHIFNVVAELLGTDSAVSSEYVLIGAHLDGWVGGTGATDNAAGVAISLEALRLLKVTGLRLRRTVRVVLYSGEEQGLLCSGAHADQHVGTIPRSRAADQVAIGTAQWSKPAGPLRRRSDYDKLSAAFNIDNGGGTARAVFTGGNPPLAALYRQWASQLADVGIPYVSDEPFWPADQVSYSELGIPGIMFLQDPLDYDSRSHRSNMDTSDRRIAADMARTDYGGCICGSDGECRRPRAANGTA
jgi:carboxypeptidase Q